MYASAVSYVPTPRACYSSTNLSLGPINVGTSRSDTFSVENCGTGTLEILAVSHTSTNPAGQPPGNWEVTPAVPPVIQLENTDPPQLFIVKLTIPYGLTADAPYSTAIQVTTNDAVGPQTKTITVSATGHVPIARIEIPPQYHDIDFGDVEIDFRFGRPLLIRNTGDIDLTFQVEYVNDQDKAEFDLALDEGSYTIPAGGQLLFRETFAPTSTGNKTVELRIHNTNDTTFTQQIISLHGIGTTPTPIDAVLLLDRSGSMAETAGEPIKIEALRSAATVFVNLLRDGVDYLGLTKYNHQNSNILTLGLIDNVRNTAQTRLAQTTDLGGIKPTGSTGIGGAMQQAANQYAYSPPVSSTDPTHVQVMIVLTDGKENKTPWINEVINGYGSYPGLFTLYPQLRTYSVGLGLASNINEGRLKNITNRGAGGFYLVTGNLTGLSVFNLENFYFKIFADAIGSSMVIDPPYSLKLEETLEVPVGIISEDREALFFFISELPETAYVFELVDPTGAIISTSGDVGGMSAQMKKAHNWMFFRIKFPALDNGASFAGTWKFRARVKEPAKWELDSSLRDSATTHNRRVQRTADTSRQARTRLHQPIVERRTTMLARILGAIALWLASIRPPKPSQFDPHTVPQYGTTYRAEGKQRVSFMAAVSSNYKLTASVSPEVPIPGQPLTLRAVLTQAGWPTTNATVTALIDRPDNTTESVNLALAEDNPNGGLFEGQYVNTSLRGTYQVTFHTTGMTEQGETATRVTNLSYFVGTSSENARSDAERCFSCRMKKILVALAFLLWIMLILILVLR